MAEHRIRTAANHRNRRRRGAAFTIIELLVVIAIIGILVALLIPAVQSARESARRAQCTNNLRQLGLAFQQYHSDQNCLPPGMVSTTGYLADGNYSGLVGILPYLDQTETFNLYDPRKFWYDAENYTAVAVQVGVFYCPSNRSDGRMNLQEVAEMWSCPLPPEVGAIDYALCKGANAFFTEKPNLLPKKLRGLFDVNSHVRLELATDGSATTIAMGDAAAGPSSNFFARKLNGEGIAANDALTGLPVALEQAWAAGCVSSDSYPYYGSIFAGTAQRGVAPTFRDEPMNPPGRLVAPTADGNDPGPDNASGKDWVSGYRSQHPGGCNFVFADGSVRFVSEGIAGNIYRALSTYAGEETVPKDGF